MKTIFSIITIFTLSAVVSTSLFEGEFFLPTAGVVSALSFVLPSAQIGVLQMAICPSTCAPSLPENYSGGCGIVTRPGGIKKFALIKCDYVFTDISDPLEWAAAIASGDIVGSGLVLAQKPKGSFTKKRIASCEPESVVGGEKTITFQDFNTDTVTPGGGTLAYDFWNAIQGNTQNYRFAYLTCDGYVYGPIDDISLEIDEVIEDNNTGNTFFDGTITWNNILMIAPVKVNLDGIL